MCGGIKLLELTKEVAVSLLPTVHVLPKERVHIIALLWSLSDYNI